MLGSCRLAARGVETTATSPEDRFALVRLHAPHGASEIVATGEGAGARIADLFAAAR